MIYRWIVVKKHLPDYFEHEKTAVQYAQLSVRQDLKEGHSDSTYIVAQVEIQYELTSDGKIKKVGGH